MVAGSEAVMITTLMVLLSAVSASSSVVEKS